MHDTTAAATSPATGRRRSFRIAVAATALAFAATILPATGATSAPEAQAAVASDSFPSATTTGARAGAHLRVHRGDLIITRPGTVIDGLDIHGYVEVRAKDVTIRNSIIRGGAASGQSALVRSASDGASLTITDSELVPNVRRHSINGLMGWNIDAQRLDIHHVIDPAHFFGSGNVQLRDSWLHDNLHYENDPGWNGGPSHDDGIQIQSGSGYWITGNRIEGAHNAGIMITQDAGRTANVMISDNFLDGGACTINAHDKGRGAFSNIDIRDNVFGAHSVYGCQLIQTAGDITFSNNTMVDGRQPRVNRH
jgi:hypothetical protein